METVRFDQLDLYPQVLRAIAEMGFEEATPIQSQAIPVVMSGVDVIGQAQTGTGKTASFGIPVLHKVDPNNKKTQVIILSPTRELAIQVAIGAIRALRDLEYRVPEDVSVIGFDGTALAEYYNPKLATIKQQYQTLATRSVEILFGQIELKRSQIHEIVPFELASGESIQKIR